MQRLATIVLSACLSSATWAQEKGGAARPDAERVEKPARLAMRHIRLLELPARRVESARVLLQMGKDAAPALARAMRDPRPDVVGRLAILLRMLRDDAVAALPMLRELADGEDAELVRAARYAMSYLQPEGVTLVADYTRARVVELDAKGKEVFVLGKMSGVFDARRLPSGNLLLALAGKQEVREVDRKGRVVWQYRHKSMNPLGVERLPNDHTLIADTSRGVLEVNRAGEVVWKAGGITPWKAEPLRNGRVLVADGNRVFELDRKGKRRWMPEQHQLQAHEARRLSGGRTLVASYIKKAVFELDATGALVRTVKVSRRPDSVDWLRDGRIVVGGVGFVQMIAVDGSQVWRAAIRRAGSVRHY